ncbi:hypothetical protein ACFSKM_19890 [Ancylobacter dichloromethanicus]
MAGRDPPVRGLNAAVSAAAAVLGAEGRGGMLVLPGDIPAVTSAEVDALIAGHGAGRAVSLVAAHDGQGTNAVLVSPPGMMTFAFGPMSFFRDIAPVRRRSASCRDAPIRRGFPALRSMSTPRSRCAGSQVCSPVRARAGCWRPRVAHNRCSGFARDDDLSRRSQPRCASGSVILSFYRPAHFGTELGLIIGIALWSAGCRPSLSYRFPSATATSTR